MDRRLKERLVGATILGLFVVVIVPELFSGPKRAIEAPQPAPSGAVEPLRSVTVDLATSRAAASEDVAASAAVADGSAPGGPAPSPDIAPAANDTSNGDLASGPRPADAAPTATAAPAGSPVQPAAPVETERQLPTPTPDPTHHAWAAQLGSFAARANAERLERQLRAEGFSPSMSATGDGAALRYRVRVGPVPDRAAAEKLVAKLKKAGHPATFVAP